MRSGRNPCQGAARRRRWSRYAPKRIGSSARPWMPRMLSNSSAIFIPGKIAERVRREELAYFLGCTVCLRLAPGVNFGALDALIFTFSPVRGLTP
jgi:hypothetical protein